MDIEMYNKLVEYINLLVTGKTNLNQLPDNFEDTLRDFLQKNFSSYFTKEFNIKFPIALKDALSNYPFVNITSVNTVDDLKSIDTTKYIISIVTDLDRGGIFIFNKDKQSLTDDGLIFNGWERLINTKQYNVKWFGAKGDGITDDTIAIQKAIDIGGKNTIIFFPKGDYYITGQLYPKAYTTWQGEGSLDFQDLFYNVNSITCDHDKYYWVHFNTDENLNKFIKGDQIFLSGFANKLTNKPHEISQIDNKNKKILIIHSYYTGSDYDEDNVNGTARIPFIIGGSAIRHRALNGRLTIGKWFIHSEDLDYFSLQDIGFVGAGINQSSGSEIKIVRNENGAMEGFQWNNVSWMDIPGNAITIEAPINSSFTNIRIKKCAFDAIKFISINGSAMTSTTVRNVYITSARRGFYIDTAVYNVFESIVIEGAAIAFHGKVMNSNTFNSISTETVKYRTFRGGQGLSFLIENGYGNVFNSPSVIYNSEPYEWVKGAFMFLGHSYATLPTAIINGGRVHNSLNYAHPLLTYEQGSDSTERLYYVDVLEDTLRNEYTKPGRFIGVHRKDYNTQESTQIERYRILEIFSGCTDCIQTDNTEYNKDTDPTQNDDADAGYNVGDLWTNTDTNITYLCVDNTNDNAVWKNFDNITVLKVQVDHTETINMKTATDLAITKIGRSVGNDIYTTMGYKVYQYEYNSSDKELYLWLDIYDRFPTLYLHKAHLDSDNKAFNSELLCSKYELVTINDIDYLQIVFKASKLIKESSNFNWHDSEIQQNDGTVYLSNTYDYIDNIKEDLIATKYQWDKDTSKLNFIFTPTRFIKDNTTITVYNNLNPLINGEYIIDSVLGWEQLDNFHKNPITIKVKINIDLGIDYDLNVSESLGCYTLTNSLTNAPSLTPSPGQIILNGSPIYRIIDPFNNITRNNIINYSITIPENETQIELPIPLSYDFTYLCNLTNVTITITNTSVIIKRSDDSTNELNGILIGYPKANRLFVGTLQEGV